MNPEVRLFVQLDGAVNGPYRLEHLRELAVGGVIKPECLAATTGEGPWTALGTRPEAAAIFPARAAVAFKEGAFDALNAPSARGVAVQDLLAAAQTGGPILRPAGGARADRAKAGAPEQLNDVQEMVRAVQANAAEFEPPVRPAPPWKMSSSGKYVLVLAGLMVLVLVGIRVGYADRWDDRSSAILLGWGALGSCLLIGVYFLFRKTEGR